MRLTTTCKSSLLCVFFLFVVCNVLEAAPCLQYKTAIFLINGVWVSQKDAQAHANALKERLSDELGCDLPVIPAYNQTVNKAEDLWAASQKLGNPIDPALARLLADGVLDIAEAKYGQLAVDAAGFFTDEIVRNIQAINGQPTTPDEEDTATHYGQYLTALNAGYSIIVIGHSEGNLFANAEYDALLSANPGLDARMKIVGVATPSFRVAGDATNTRYTSFHGDPITEVFDIRGRRALPANVSSEDCTDNVSFIAGLLCHQFDTYLYRTDSWDSISTHVRSLLARVARFSFNGIVTAVVDSQNSLAGRVPVGTALQGTFLYGLDAADLSPGDPATGFYKVAAPPGFIRVTLNTTIGPRTVATDPSAPGFAIGLVGPIALNVSNGALGDGFSLLGLGTQATWQLPTLARPLIGIQLIDGRAPFTFLTSDAPPSNLDLSQTQDGYFGAATFGNSYIQSGQGTSVYVIQFRLTSLNRQ